MGAQGRLNLAPQGAGDALEVQGDRPQQGNRPQLQHGIDHFWYWPNWAS